MVSVVAFIFAYLFWRGGESYVVLLFIGIGVVLALRVINIVLNSEEIY